MNLAPPVNHVFVDFENVHEIDHSVIGSSTVSFTLLIGARQTKIDTALVEKLLEHADSVHLVRLTSTGRNALDFTLAYYVGRAVVTDPTGIFHIISKDTGYDALVAHLRSKHIHAHRHQDFTGLPFSHPQKTETSATAKSSTPAPAKTAAAPKPAKTPKPSTPVLNERASRALEHLRQHPKNRPSREKTLVSHILSLFIKDKITEAEARSVIETLRHAGCIVVDEKGGLTYQLPAST